MTILGLGTRPQSPEQTQPQYTQRRPFHSRTPPSDCARPCPDAADQGVMERFSCKMAIAPTASISIICGGTSACIEPIPANIYTHKTLSGSFSIKNPYLEKMLKEKAKDSQTVWNSILEHGGSVLHSTTGLIGTLVSGSFL